MNKGKVCDTGGAGFIGSSLVYSLLQNGYTVHATLRNLGDESKVELSRGFPCAQEKLRLFEADIYNPQEFEEAIKGCVFVFHVATPLQHTTNYKYKDKIEATISAVKEIADICIRSGTVRRLIYTASIVSASPLKDDGSGYKVTMDESCWTLFHNDIPFSDDYVKDYTEVKTKAEKEILKIGEENESGLEVVTLACGLVGGPGHLPYVAASVLTIVSKIINNLTHYQNLKYLEELLGKIPIVHIEDVCRAHIFCAETPLVKGRFLCACSFVSSEEISDYYKNNYPQYHHLIQEHLEGVKREIEWGSRKLEDNGFFYKYNTKAILEDSLECAKRCGHI